MDYNHPELPSTWCLPHPVSPIDTYIDDMYLIVVYHFRHELLALHQANTPQFYPECAQLIVTGSGTSSPSSDYLVSIPGAWGANDPGVNINVS